MISSLWHLWRELQEVTELANEAKRMFYREVNRAMGEARLVRDKADKIEELIEEARSSFSIQLREAEKKVERWREEVYSLLRAMDEKVEAREAEKKVERLREEVYSLLRAMDEKVAAKVDALRDEIEDTLSAHSRGRR